MKLLRFDGEYLTEKLKQELAAAGVPSEWTEVGDDGSVSARSLVVQREEDTAVCYADPVLDERNEFVLDKDGKPRFTLRWRRLGKGEPVNPPADAIPGDAAPGVHVPLGPGGATIAVPGDTSDALVAKVVAAHDPTPPRPTPREAHAADIALAQIAQLDPKKATVADIIATAKKASA